MAGGWGLGGKWQLARPGIAAQLVGRVRVTLEIDGRLLGFQEELAGAADPEAVVGGLVSTAYPDGIFVDHLPVGLGVTLLVVDIPAQRLEERVNEITAQRGFFVVTGAVGFQVAVKPLD